MKTLKNDLYSVLFGLLGGFVIFICSFGSENVWAAHAATTKGEIEKRPAPVFRRVCVGGSNNGNYCKQNSECCTECRGEFHPYCTKRNVYNITVAVLYDAPANGITSIQDLITAMSAALFDVTDGQAEIGIATIHNNATSSNQADLVIHPSTNDTWWQANSGHYRTGGFMEVSINQITNPANQGYILAHEFTHLVFDARDEYENRQSNCGAIISQCAGGTNTGNACDPNADCPGSVCNNASVCAGGVNAGNACNRNVNCPGFVCDSTIGDCPHPAAAAETSLMDGNGTEFCWGQADSTNLTNLSGGNHDPFNTTEQSSCRSNRSVWDQVVWSWPTTFLKPTGAPDPAANGAVVNAPKFVITNDNVRVVLVLDESGSMNLESPKRLERLKVAAKDFIATAENNTELGIISYSTTANSADGHASIAITALGNNRSTWNNAIDGLGANGWTNIGDGLQKAKDMIVAAGGVTANTYIILMTDGLNNRPEPQATADADLKAKIADLLLSGIPVYVTCTGGDFGLQSQCAEIANGTNGFNADSANPAKLPENFLDFHERITGYQAIDSVYGDFANIDTKSPKTIFVDEGSESISFSLLWENATANVTMILKDPDGNIHQTRPIPQGRYARIDKPKAGNWQMTINPHGSTKFVARAYTHNRINNFTASLRKPSFKPNEEIYIYAIVRSISGTVTKEGEKIITIVTLPDGTKDTVELFDNGRDAGGHGDDMAGDGIFTGVYTNTAQKGAYSFHLKVNVDQWRPGEEAHTRDVNQKSPRFIREIRISAGVNDPNDIITKPEDETSTSIIMSRTNPTLCMGVKHKVSEGANVQLYDCSATDVHKNWHIKTSEKRVCQTGDNNALYCIDFRSGSVDAIVTQEADWKNNQRWLYNPQDYKFHGSGANICLDVEAQSINSQVKVTKCEDSKHYQEWGINPNNVITKPEDKTSASVIMSRTNPTLCVGVKHKVSEGANVQLYDCSATDVHKNWHIETSKKKVCQTGDDNALYCIDFRSGSVDAIVTQEADWKNNQRWLYNPQDHKFHGSGVNICLDVEAQSVNSQVKVTKCEDSKHYQEWKIN